MNKTVKKTYKALEAIFLLFIAGGWLVVAIIYLIVYGVYLLIK